MNILVEEKLHKAARAVLKKYGTPEFNLAKARFEALGEMARTCGVVAPKVIEDIRNYETKRWDEERKANAQEEKMYHVVCQMMDAQEKKEKLFRKEELLNLDHGPLAMIMQPLQQTGIIFGIGRASESLAESLSDAIVNNPGANLFDIHLAVTHQLHEWERACNGEYLDNPLDSLTAVEWDGGENGYMVVLGKDPLEVVQNVFKAFKENSCNESNGFDTLTIHEVSSEEAMRIMEQLAQQDNKGR